MDEALNTRGIARILVRTERLLLREWRESDLCPFAEMNADPVVMEHFPRVLSREESDAAAGRVRRSFEDHGFGLFALEVPGVSEFAGFVGLTIPAFVAHFTPCVEIGWRLGRAFWNRGYATEGARAMLQTGFLTLGLDEIVAMTVPNNVRSRRVMHKLGMTRDPTDDFDHPLVLPESPLRRHVLYRVRNPAPHSR